ncbi:unnamed protein product [Coregonus sp. 'balchen']|nr:unnamed protein product [Coregonus sp. 'balchen']
MAASPLPERDSAPLLQLQEVDPSRVGRGGRILSPIFSAPSPPLPMEAHPICIPSPYTDIGHDFNPLSFYSPTLLSYGGPALPDCPSARQSLSPSFFWPPHAHVGPSLALHHRPQSRPQQGQPTRVPWVELSPRDHALSESSKPLRKRSQEGEETVISPEGKAELHFCAVCHDYASGYHYGIPFSGAKGHNDYICPATNQCTIDKNRRKSCQACRLRKCYEVGMTKCGMRRDRSSYRGHQPRRVGRFSRGAASGPKRALAERGEPIKELLPPALTPEQLIGRIMEAEPPEIYLQRDMRRPLTEANVMMSLTNLADKELVHMISWAKKIPGWDEGSCVQGFVDIFDMLLAATSRFRELKLQREEYVCLKAMILLNSNMCLNSSEGSEELQSRSKLLRLLDAVTDALVWAIAKTGLSFQQQSARLAHLLMLLSHIRHVSNKGMDHLHCMKMKNIVPLYDLLLEMLDAHIMHSPQLPQQATSGGHCPEVSPLQPTTPAAAPPRHGPPAVEASPKNRSHWTAGTPALALF